jgi:hypothetical protein
MSQVTWLYSDKNGMDYEINIYHGDESGHLLIYINDKIMQIDFGIFNSRNYTFMIDEVFFELSVKAAHGEFEYSLSGDGSALDKKLKIKNLPKSKTVHTVTLALFLLAFLLLFILLYFLIF